MNIIKLIILFCGICLSNASNAQSELPIRFTVNCPYKGNPDKIELVVENRSAKTFFYSIALQGYKGTTRIRLLSDINFMGQNEGVVLKPIKSKGKAVKVVSKKEIFYQFDYHNLDKILFGVMYYEKQDFDSKGDIIYSKTIPK